MKGIKFRFGQILTHVLFYGASSSRLLLLLLQSLGKSTSMRLRLCVFHKFFAKVGITVCFWWRVMNRCQDTTCCYFRWERIRPIYFTINPFISSAAPICSDKALSISLPPSHLSSSSTPSVCFKLKSSSHIQNSIRELNSAFWRQRSAWRAPIHDAVLHECISENEFKQHTAQETPPCLSDD